MFKHFLILLIFAQTVLAVPLIETSTGISASIGVNSSPLPPEPSPPYSGGGGGGGYSCRHLITCGEWSECRNGIMEVTCYNPCRRANFTQTTLCVEKRNQTVNDTIVKEVVKEPEPPKDEPKPITEPPKEEPVIEEAVEEERDKLIFGLPLWQIIIPLFIILMAALIWFLLGKKKKKDKELEKDIAPALIEPKKEELPNRLIPLRDWFTKRNYYKLSKKESVRLALENGWSEEEVKLVAN